MSSQVLSNDARVQCPRAMSLFRYGRDFYTEEAAQQLLSTEALLLISLVGVFIAVHLLADRWAIRSPTPPLSHCLRRRESSDMRSAPGCITGVTRASCSGWSVEPLKSIVVNSQGPTPS